jgi:nucleoside-diphosphate-sugar epimerase
MRILVIGCGYVGIPLGRLLSARGHTVLGLRRSNDADSQLLASGITPIHADITNPADLSRIAPGFDAVINLVSSSKGGIEDYRHVYFEGTRNILRWLSQSPPRVFIYTSSTSVYAQTDGGWVTEESSAEPDSPTSRVLLETEQLLLNAHRTSGFPAIILRPSGIYGPDRGHLFKQFIRSEATLRDDGSAWINMIHVDDLAAAIAHLINHGIPRETYNATDDEPVTQRDFFQWLSAQLNRPMPPSSPPNPNRKRGITSKRVSNAKLKATGFQFTYPTFREGYNPEIEHLTTP